jgi:hypothetical protein
VRGLHTCKKNAHQLAATVTAWHAICGTFPLKIASPGVEERVKITFLAPDPHAGRQAALVCKGLVDAQATGADGFRV